MTSDNWYVRLENKTYGPFTGAQIQEHLSHGRLGPDSEISLGGRDWTTVEASRRFHLPARPEPEVRDVPIVASAVPAHRWYFRKNGQVHGPYPKPQIEEYLILGRLAPSSEISLDGQYWMTIAASGYFRPARAADGADRDDAAWAAERSRARHRWLDERIYAEPPENAPTRIPEAPEIEALRHDHQVTQHLLQAQRDHRPQYWLAGLATLVVVTAAYFIWHSQGEGIVLVRTDPGVVDCDRVVAGVNWTGCDKRDVQLVGAGLKSAHLVSTRLDNADLRGANLAYATLERASLRAANLEAAAMRGTDLSRADLTGANLARADLSYATLTGARIEGVRLDGARLDRAGWIDGRVCAEGSIGECR